MDSHPKHPFINYDKQATRDQVKAQWTWWFLDTFDRASKIEHVDEAVKFAEDCAEELLKGLTQAVFDITGKKIT